MSSSEDIANEIEFAKIQKAELELDMEDITNELPTLLEIKQKLQEEFEAVKKKLAEAEANVNKKLQIKQQKQLGIKNVEANLNKLGLELWKAQADENRRLADKKKLESFDKIAADMYWRQFIKPHQMYAAKSFALNGGKAILGDRRGLGKTLTALATCDLVGAKKVLLISIPDILLNFEKEVRKWSPHRTLITMVGKDAAYRDFATKVMLPSMNEFVLTVNFQAWKRDKTLWKDLAKLQFDMVIVDEAHRISNHESDSHRGVKNIIRMHNLCPSCGHNELRILNPEKDLWECLNKSCELIQHGDDCRSVKNVLMLTGSPVKNRPTEFEALANLVYPEAFPNLTKFREAYCKREPYTTLTGGTGYRWAWKDDTGAAECMQMMGPHFLQRDRKSAGVEIPNQEIQTYFIPWDKENYGEQLRLYELLKERSLITLNDGSAEIAAKNVMELILRWRQMTSWPMGIKLKHPETGAITFECDLAKSQKLDRAVSLIRELVAEGERVVFFSKFVPAIQEINRRLDEPWIDENGEKVTVRSVPYYGDSNYNMPSHKAKALKAAIREDFDASTCDSANYRWDVVLGQYDTCREGVNFNDATQMVILDLEWNPEMQGQAFGRIDRMGQTRETTVHLLMMEGTIDQGIYNLQLDKQNMVDEFNDGAEATRKLIMMLQDGMF